MTLTSLICHLVWMFSLVAVNHAQLDEPAYREQFMKVCPKQNTTEKFIYSVEVSSVNQCAVRCVNENSCKSANLCSSGGSKLCTLSGKYPWTGCDGNTASEDCMYIVPKMACLNGGTANETGQHCTCPEIYTGEFCERLYYDCNEAGVVDYKTTWIQRGGHPPFTVRCYMYYTYILKAFSYYFTGNNFPLNKTFDEYKTIFQSQGYINGGLESIHTATSQAYYTLTVDVRLITPAKIYITNYHNFTLASASERYRLDYLSVTGGPDGLAAMNGRPFSAVGNDPEGCAQMHNVAWWYTVDCRVPMIYNNNRKVSYPDYHAPTTFKGYDLIFMYMEFKGLK